MRKYLGLIIVLGNIAFALDLKPYKILSNFSTYSEYSKKEFQKNFKKILGRPQGIWIYEPQNKIYVADTLRNRLVAYDLKKLKYLDYFNAGGNLKFPYDVSKISNYRFLVGLIENPYYKVVLIDLKNREMVTLLKKSKKPIIFGNYIFLSGTGEIYKLEGNDLIKIGKIDKGFIDIYIDNGKIYVLYPNFLVKIYNMYNLKNINTINIKPYTYLPACIGAKNGLIFIGDKFLGEIIVFNKNGKYINEFGGKGYRDFAINEPVKMRFYKNYLFLLDMGNNHVDIFKINF